MRVQAASLTADDEAKPTNIVGTDPFAVLTAFLQGSTHGSPRAKAPRLWPHRNRNETSHARKSGGVEDRRFGAHVSFVCSALADQYEP